MLQEVEWGEFVLEDLFDSSNGDFDIQKNHINNKGCFVVTAGLSNYGILGKSNISAKIFNRGTFTIDMFGNAFFRQHEYKMVTHARVFSLTPKISINDNQGLFLSTIFHFLNKKFGYENMCSWEKIKKESILLPIMNNKVDFEFMDKFISELETERLAELKAYLSITGLKDYKLNDEDKLVLCNYSNLKWNVYNLEDLFGKSTRGRRLKSADRIPGTLPFVTAGEANEGISDFIGNNVTVFSANTTTIDMFGSAKYRNYMYGGDDHIAVVHTEKLPKMASIFITSAIHKSAHSGKFDYSNNFYASDADELNISLPTKEGKPDFEVMGKIISAVHKLVIKDVVLYADKRIEATKEIINKE